MSGTSTSRPQFTTTHLDASTSPYAFRGFGVVPLNDRGDIRLTLATLAGEQLTVDLRPINARGLIEHLQSQLNRTATGPVDRHCARIP